MLLREACGVLSLLAGSLNALIQKCKLSDALMKSLN